MSESGHNTSECVPGQIVGFGVDAGQVWSRSPYVVTPQIKKKKVSVALQRQMDAVTHTRAKCRAYRQADTWLQIKCHQKLEGKGGVLNVCLSLCRAYTIWPRICGQHYQHYLL